MIASPLAVSAEKPTNFAGFVVMVHGEPLRVGLALADVTTSLLGDEESLILGCGDSVLLFNCPSMGLRGYAGPASTRPGGAISQPDESLAAGAPATALRPIFLRDPSEVQFLWNRSPSPVRPLFSQLDGLPGQPAFKAPERVILFLLMNAA